MKMNAATLDHTVKDVGRASRNILDLRKTKPCKLLVVISRTNLCRLLLILCQLSLVLDGHNEGGSAAMLGGLAAAHDIVVQL